MRATTVRVRLYENTSACFCCPVWTDVVKRWLWKQQRGRTSPSLTSCIFKLSWLRVDVIWDTLTNTRSDGLKEMSKNNHAIDSRALEHHNDQVRTVFFDQLKGRKMAEYTQKRAKGRRRKLHTGSWSKGLRCRKERDCRGEERRGKLDEWNWS